MGNLAMGALGAATNTYVTNSILTNLINFLAPVLGIALVIFTVVQGVQIFSGREGSSVKKLISGVLMILFLLGIMYAAGSFSAYGDLFKGLTDGLINKGGDNAKSILG